MFRSKSITWIIFAFCVTTGSCEDFYQSIGEDVKMNCPGDTSKAISVEWKLNNAIVLSMTRKSGNTRRGALDVTHRARIEGTALKISSVKETDAGTYTCNQFPTSHKLYVASAFGNPSAVLYSSETSLTCGVFPDNNKVKYQWLTPSPSEYGTSKTVTVKPVTSDHAGTWTCQIKSEKGTVKELKVHLSVVGPLNTVKEVTATQGGIAKLPCLLPAPGKLTIKRVSWTSVTPPNVRFPALMITQGDLQWNIANVSTDRVIFSDQNLNSIFNVTLKKVRTADAGEYMCRLEFENGLSLNATVNLIVLKGDGFAPDSDSNDPNVTKTSTWHKYYWGVQLWIWIAVAASSLVLISLVVIIVLIHCRNKRMKRKIKKTKSMQQPLTSRNYCKCDRTVRQPGTGRKERPPPLPRHQYSSLNH